MDYANPAALTETDWLAGHLDNPTVIVLDASWHLPTVDRSAIDEYRKAHISGAVFFDIDAVSDQESNLPHMLPSPEEFAEKVSALGIGNHHLVVIYDSYGLFSAARVWWMFRVFGHENVSILNGGLPKWCEEGRPLSDQQISRPAAVFQPTFRPDMVHSLEEVTAIVSGNTRQILDARSKGRFLGEAPEPRAGLRSGHIPGSLNLPFDQLLDPDRKTVLPATEIAGRFAAAGITAGQGVTCSCGTGVTACALALGLHLIGFKDVAVYDGSWTEWGGRQDTPVEI